MRNAFFHIKLLAALLGLFQVTFLSAQEGQIKGSIGNGNENLPAASVSLGGKTFFTNLNGEFFFSVKAGSYVLTVTHVGYKIMEATVSVKTGTTQILHFTLSPAEQMGEAVLLGSRSVFQRSNLSTPVPVDVLSSARLRETSQVSLPQMLNFSAPSFNASREILNESATLRGLDPHHVLILVNGIRYHNMAWLYGRGLKGHLGPGSVGNDLNSIPFSAIEKIEILRDGASAQYY